jgi:superfamily II DNA or RNA helicase
MTRLRDFSFAESYDKSVDSIAEEFYLPCMSSANRYDRISGYFSSAVFSISWPALKKFVNCGGKIRLICSPVFSGADVAALKEGYGSLDSDELSAALVAELRVLLDNERSNKPARVLAGLIAAGIVDMRIAIPSADLSPGDRRLFHDKVGLFTDADGDAVGFRGSMNETFLGLASDGNLESIDVFPSWVGGRDSRRVDHAAGRFELLWRNEVTAVDVREVPDGAAAVIRSAGPADWEVLVDEMLAEAAVRVAAPSGSRQLREHQVQAIAAWELHDRRGILEHATGSGKTYTAIHAIRSVLKENGSALVIVPSSLLLKQWYQELSHHLSDLNPQILLAGDGNDSWRSDDMLQPWTRESSSSGSRIVITTMQTAASEGFMMRLSRNRRMLLVADEAHRLGSKGAQRILSLQPPWRLGLSATPTRSGDAEGTARLLEFFGGIIPPPYTLRDAIKDGVLTPYNYVIHEAPLREDEQAGYDSLTRKIRIEAARSSDVDGGISNNEKLRKMAIARARILKQAAEKVPLAVRVLTDHFEPGQRWLVYCDSLAQLKKIREALADSGLDSLEYHSAMSGDKGATLTELEINGGILVSVRCLDEGVDLPAVSHALILASSKNPREFVQRRGRILRRYPGKSLAFLHDAVVLPPEDPERPAPGSDRLLAGELYRVLEFARSAANPQVLSRIENLCIRYGVPIGIDDSLAMIGVEGETETDDTDDESKE